MIGADDLAVAQDRLVVEEQRLGILQPELHQPALQSGLALPQHRVAADEIALAGLHRKAEAGLQHMVLVGDVVAEMAEGLFDAAGIERMQAAELQPESAPASSIASKTCAAWSVET